MGVGVRRWVRRGTVLREGHCKRNQSCTRGRKHGTVLKSKKIARIRAIFALFSHECELHANANETCVRQFEYAREFNNCL